MPKIFNSTIPYVDQPCDRCGSKKKVSKTWEEEIKTFYGVTTLVHSQMICTNDECQVKFDKQMKVEKADRKKALKIKEANAKARSINLRKTKKN